MAYGGEVCEAGSGGGSCGDLSWSWAKRKRKKSQRRREKGKMKLGKNYRIEDTRKVKKWMLKKKEKDK